MRKFLLGSIAILALAAPMAASAQFNVGLRLNYGIPMGDAQKDQKMTDGVSGQIPIQLDVGYRVLPELTVGVYGSYGYAMIASNSKDFMNSAYTLNFGVQALYDFPAFQQIKPWAGLGIGYEMFNGSVKDAAGGGTMSYDGWEFARLQVGADYSVAKNFSTGLFLSYSFAEFGSAKLSGNSDPTANFSGSITDKTMHQWFQIGIRGSYDL